MSTDSGQEPEAKGSLSPEVLERLFSFPGENEHKHIIQELNEQTPRGLAVTGGAYLEWKVREAIKSLLPVWDETADQLFGTPEKTGGLSFGHQCKVAYCLGIVGKAALKDLEIIGEVRNRFAHRLLVRNFENEKIIGQINNLTSLSHANAPLNLPLFDYLKDKPKGTFLVTIHFLGLMISSSAHQILRHRQFPSVSEHSDFWW